MDSADCKRVSFRRKFHENDLFYLWCSQTTLPTNIIKNLFTSCKEIKNHSIFSDILDKKSYQEYLRLGFQPLRYEINVLAKENEKFATLVEFDRKKMERLDAKIWAFEIDSLGIKNLNIISLLAQYQANLVSPLLCEQDSIYCHFSAVTESNVLLQGVIDKTEYPHLLRLIYTVPIE